MYVIDGLMLTEAIQLESKLHDELEYLQTRLTEVRDRIGHLTSLLVF